MSASEEAELADERDAILAKRARSHKLALWFLVLGLLSFVLIGAVNEHLGPQDEPGPVVFLALLPIACWFPMFTYFIKYKGQPDILALLSCAGCPGLIALCVIPDLHKRRIEEIDEFLGNTA